MGKKLKQPIVPSTPALRPWYLAPIAWQASSTSGMLLSTASRHSGSISAVWPKRWTGMMALVFSVIAAAVCETVSSSMSMQ